MLSEAFGLCVDFGEHVWAMLMRNLRIGNFLACIGTSVHSFFSPTVLQCGRL